MCAAVSVLSERLLQGLARGAEAFENTTQRATADNSRGVGASPAPSRLIGMSWQQEKTAGNVGAGGSISRASQRHVVHSGWLKKQGDMRKNWKRRW